ncbi:class II glutamine amidotransferase [Pseudonocardia halophobica]|uniref:Class II glutamine amidotransferase n=1 Tax=Pseudonocardia halophobica TaxID=29401 RepID=A0A9W6KXN0_9PSEU|nr:class II glutamine amidotransferase [Pseudonocardia halophobica]GLL09947.1 class II glutamine amidotransferase [Pseudonocardia halophobica]
MCRWLGYYGNPIEPKELIYDTRHSLIEQSRRAAPDSAIANGDGFGLGWYGKGRDAALYRSESPAWGDRNLREIAGVVQSGLFLAHVRAATGTPVQQTNCHPFRYRNWIFVHNGFVDRWAQLRRDLLFAVRPDLFDNVQGSTDSEVLFHLALTFGLEEEPLPALERMAGYVEAAGHAAGSEHPLQMTVGVADGERLYAVRYASGPVVNTLYVSSEVDALRRLYPEDERWQHFSEDSRAVVSEPLTDLPGLWHEVPPSTALVLQKGPDVEQPFRPQPPS